MGRWASASRPLRAACAVLTLAAAGCASRPAPTPAAVAVAPSEVVRLWPGRPPGEGAAEGPETVGSEGAATGAYWNVSEPRMDVYRPARPNGTAVLVIGGGGYFRIQIGSAAAPIARWLQSEGVTAFVLYYRLPGDGWGVETPFIDGQRAMRLIRARAAAYDIDPDRVGIIGTSAGGHLAATLATQGNRDFYVPAEAADRLPARPDFAGLVYPVVSLRAPIDTTRTRRELGRAPNAVERFSAERHVDAATPPLFLAHAADDPIADPRHSQWMYEAMRAAGRPVELHVFTTGGHSFGLGAPGTPAAAWPGLFAAWARTQGFMRRSR